MRTAITHFMHIYSGGGVYMWHMCVLAQANDADRNAADYCIIRQNGDEN